MAFGLTKPQSTTDAGILGNGAGTPLTHSLSGHLPSTGTRRRIRDQIGDGRMFLELGHGGVDFLGILAMLNERGWKGWMTHVVCAPVACGRT